ncbi:MAG: cytochrome b, partial [Acetobacteraceae bacterium]
FVLFFVVAARLAYRIAHGPPPQDPTLAPWQVAASTVTHGAMYALLLSVPVLGWFGVQLYPALQIYGLFSLPAVVSPDNATAEVVLFIHRSIALVLGGLIGLHVAAALFHYFIRKDNVLSRMIPRLARRDRA